MKVKKILKVTLIILLSFSSIYFYNGFFGNPISYIKAKSKISSYIDENYKGMLRTDDISYNLKMNGYSAYVVDKDDARNSSNIYYYNTGNIGDDYYFRTKMNMEDEIKNTLESIITQYTNIKRENLTIDAQIEIDKFRYRLFDRYSGKEPIKLSINLHPKYNFDESFYKNEEEFKKDANEILNLIKSTKYKYDDIEIYSFREDGNSSYTLNSNEELYIKEYKKEESIE